MSIRNNMQLVATLFGAALTLTAAAETTGVQFSAEIVTHGTDAPPMTSKMFVGDGKVRIEMTQEGQTMVRISDQRKRAEWLLFPDKQRYLERTDPAPDASTPAVTTPSAENNPCAGLPGVDCRRIGEEAVAGRPAIKWEMTVTQDGKTLTGAQWLDVQRGVPLKYQMPNGQTMELKLLGTETLAGRPVEKWEMTTVIPDQPPLQIFQWFDPELKLPVREEFPGGNVRELDKIQIGSQPDELFRVPAGYERMDMPPQESQQ